MKFLIPSLIVLFSLTSFAKVNSNITLDIRDCDLFFTNQIGNQFFADIVDLEYNISILEINVASYNSKVQTMNGTLMYWETSLNTREKVDVPKNIKFKVTSFQRGQDQISFNLEYSYLYKGEKRKLLVGPVTINNEKDYDYPMIKVQYSPNKANVNTCLADFDDN